MEDDLKKVLDAIVKNIEVTNKRFEVIESTLETMMNGDRLLMSTDLKQKEQIESIGKQLTALNDLMARHMKLH